jgi:aspartokinase/homoserine dehydrogenase 1
MKILKFGGTSVGNAERILNVARIVQSYAAAGEKFAVVVSAIGGMTDRLIQMSRIAAGGSESYRQLLEYYSDVHRQVAHSLIEDPDRRAAVVQELVDGQIELGNLLHGIYLTRDLSLKTLDYIQSFGERSCAFILTETLNGLGVDALYVNARSLVKTNESYGSAKVYFEETNRNIVQHFANYPYKISVITGFIASTREGITTTLGRGGSDYTAAIFGAALQAEEIQIWTDVDGVLTADPRKVKQAFPLTSMSYEEALEMSHFGAKVIYPPTILPALEKKIPLRIKNSFNPDAPGTLICDCPEPYPGSVKGIASISNVSLLTFEGGGLFAASSTAARLFSVLAQQHINSILITQGSSQHSICLAIKPEEALTARDAIDGEFALEIQAKLVNPVRLEHDRAILSIIGDNMRSQPGISGKFFDALGKNGINIIVTAQGSSERNISVVIRKEDETKALNATHDVFFLSNYYVMNLFVVGVGLIGSTLLKQIEQQREYLRNEMYVELRVVALANSRRMYFSPDGIDLKTWREQIETGVPTDLPAFVQTMRSLNLPNSVFVDNTADASIRHLYAEILENSISISTPNKVAVSSEYELYRRLKRLAETRSVKFFYETNVGAGLPVLTTLNDLIYSGDRILKIQGVLSGSLSFIFNSFREGTRFSDIVLEARKLGYTEPDPRIDLSGKDVARKLLILARETGRQLEIDDIQVENILPQACLDAPSVEAFLTELEQANDRFESLRTSAASDGKALRYLATLEGDEVRISLESLGPENPFYNLSGSDNMIVFTTERYKERPLVIKGPGAGAEVTAAGVFAELLRIGYYLS